jgi:cardiolipin synthase
MNFNLPNALTLSRVLAAPAICLLLLVGGIIGSWLALASYVFACITDFLDGYLARTWQQQSNFGRMLDPIADKLLVASVLLVLVAIDRLQGWALAPAAVILWREILVSGLREYLAELRVSVPVTRLAKWKTTLQMIALGFLIVGDSAAPLGGVSAVTIGTAGLWLAAALTLLTGYDYLRASLHHLDTGAAEKRSGKPGIDAAERPSGLH